MATAKRSFQAAWCWFNTAFSTGFRTIEIPLCNLFFIPHRSLPYRFTGDHTRNHYRRVRLYPAFGDTNCSGATTKAMRTNIFVCVWPFLAHIHSLIAHSALARTRITRDFVLPDCGNLFNCGKACISRGFNPHRPIMGHHCRIVFAYRDDHSPGPFPPPSLGGHRNGYVYPTFRCCNRYHIQHLCLPYLQ